MNVRQQIQLVLTVFIVIGMVSWPVPGGAEGGPAVDHAGGPRNRIEVELRADQAPSPGGIATFSLEATPLISAPDLQIEWFVPPEVELLGAPNESFGSVAANQTVHSQRQVRFPSKGVFKVAVWAGFSPADGIQLGASGVLFFTIAAHGSKVSDMDPQARSPMGSLMPTSITVEPVHTLAPSSTDGDPCFAVNGTVTRIDREPTHSGYAADKRVPVRYALVEIREEDTVFDDSYGEVLTNANGYYSFAFCDDDGWGDDTLEIYVRLWAEIYADNTFVAEVIDSSWIDEVYEFNSWRQSSGGGTLTFDLPLNEEQSAVFNIADAVYEAWAYWKESGGEKGGDALFDEEGEVHWEPGYGDKGSYYYWPWEEITIADDPSDPDEWDDSVIIHEWGHMADDRYSCDDSPGGDHSVSSLLDPELAWGEGYPDYWQSAVRAGMGHTDSNYYIDVGGTKGSVIVDIESWHLRTPSIVSDLNEFAVAAALWDLNDEVNDGGDRASHGHAMIQSVYTSETFEDIAYGFLDDTCDFKNFVRAWVKDGNPADLYTAAAIRQNTGYWMPPGPDYVWWDRVTQVVDNSASMAGTKFDAVKTILAEIVNDLGSQPQGTEFSLYTFDVPSLDFYKVYEGFFFPDVINPLINQLTTYATVDQDCQVDALEALSRAVEKQYGGDVWLFTDTETKQNDPSVETMKQRLNAHLVRASIALLGLETCSTTTTASQEQTEASSVRLKGAAQAALGLAAADTPDGLVPYLLTAINSGGQFLYVNPNQLGDAADILRAQISHSAGAGRWSDYVSDNFTYSWDRLTLGEFNWIDATIGGVEWGNPPDEGYRHVALPQYFTYYNNPYLVPHVYENGYITFGDYYGEQALNDELPIPAAPNNALYPYWDNLEWEIEGLLSEDAVSGDGYIYTKRDGDWFAIEYYRFYPLEFSPQFMTFEVLLNLANGEIRYLYETAPDGAGSATIGLENAAGSAGVQVSFNDVSGASNGMGYKFVPMPPQPSKTYRVEVDSLMDEVYFLLTGYSGSFEHLKVYFPDGTMVSCLDQTNVICLDLGLVQYVQVKVNDRVGEWKAVVDAGPTGSGTYSFHSNAASAVSAQSMNDRSLSTAGKEALLVKVGQALDGNTLTGWFRTPNDQPFGNSFTLYDDGLHADGLAADGLFGSDPYTPAEAGTGYLYVEGQLGGTSFVRSDPIPFTFQPVSISSPGDGVNLGGGTELSFEIKNLDSQDHCYWYDTLKPEGWWIDGLGWIPMVCINAGETQTTTLTVYMATGDTNDLPSGTTGEVTLTVTEYGEGIMSDSATARVTRHRAPATINIYNPTIYLRPGGDSATLDFTVLDDEAKVVADGTEVQLSASLGSMSPAIGITHGGFFTATFTSGSTEGTAIITAATTNNVSATTEVDIATPKANQIMLEVSPRLVPPDGISTSNLVATVKDRWGTPVADEVVRIGVSGDGQLGTINGSEVLTGTTDTQGQFSATLTSGTTAGEARVRAELLVLDADGYRRVHEDQQVIDMIVPEVYLPFIMR